VELVNNTLPETKNRFYELNNFSLGYWLSPLRGGIIESNEKMTEQFYFNQ